MENIKITDKEMNEVLEVENIVITERKQSGVMKVLVEVMTGENTDCKSRILVATILKCKELNLEYDTKNILKNINNIMSWVRNPEKDNYPKWAGNYKEIGKYKIKLK